MQSKNTFLRRAAAAIAALFTLSFAGCGQTPIDSGSLPVSGVVSESPVSDSEQTAGVTEDGGFTIHFIDVGQADSALVTCDGHSMLIDGGNVDDSDLVYSVLERETDGHLDYVVGTHAHEDHIGGLSGAFEAVTADVTYCPVTEYDSKAFRNFKQRAEERGNGLTIPSVGDTFSLGDAEVTVIAVNSVPDDTNNTSIVLRIVYGETSFLFTGDAEEPAEDVILQSGQDIQSTVLKVGHHGSRTSTSEAFLDTVNPAYAVISCGKDNSYGHPHDITLAKLQSKDIEVFRTDEMGDIYCTSDGKDVTFTYGEYHQAAESTTTDTVEVEESQQKDTTVSTYVLNTNSMKFQMLGNGDDRGEPILIKTANTTKEVWCPFYADKVAIESANVFKRVYAEVKAAYEENGAFAKFDTLNHEEKMCEISSYVMHNFENILKKIEAIPGVQAGKY